MHLYTIKGQQEHWKEPAFLLAKYSIATLLKQRHIYNNSWTCLADTNSVGPLWAIKAETSLSGLSRYKDKYLTRYQEIQEHLQGKLLQQLFSHIGASAEFSESFFTHATCRGSISIWL